MKKRLTALLLCLALVFGLSGCVGDTYVNAATIDGYEISSGLYLMAQYTAYGEARNMVEDSAKDVLKQKVEGQGAKSWIKARTEELLRRYVAVRRLCREKDIWMDETGQSNIEQMMQYWTYLEGIYTENGISQATFQRFLSIDEYSRMLFSSLFAEGGELYVSDAELKSEYAEKYGHARMISIPLNSSAEGVDVSGQVVDMARAMVQKLEGGATLEEIAEDDVADVYEILLRDYDVSTAADGIFESWIEYAQEESTTYSREELDLLKSQQTGDYGVVVTESTVIVYEKLDIFESEESFQERRETVLSALKSDVYEEYLRGIFDTYEINWVFGARWYMRPSKIKQ